MKTDVVILGAGPVGLFSSFYAGMRGLNCIVVDQLEEVGGQLSALYPEKNIYDVAGFNEIKAKDLVNNLLELLGKDGIFFFIIAKLSGAVPLSLRYF